MLVACRITTLVALLLHSIFGCSLHHAAMCDSQTHGQTLHSCKSGDNPSVQDKSDCCHNHDGHDHGNGAGNSDSGAVAGSEIVPVCPGCEPGPCDGNLPGCHSTGACSFVPSSNVVFECDAILVGFILQDFVPSMARCRALARWQNYGQQFSYGDSLSRCAFLCTWRI